MRRLERAPVGLRLHVARDRVLSGSASSRARRARAARAERPRAAPSRRAGGRPGDQERAREREERVPADRLQDVVRARRARARARSRPAPRRRVNGRRRACPRGRRAGSAPIPIASAFGSEVSLVTSWTTTGIVPTCSRRSSSRDGGAQRGIVAAGASARGTGETNANSAASPTNAGAARSHQRSPTQPREPHHDRERDAEEDERAAEREPAAEDRLDVARVREAVAAIPPELERPSNGSSATQSSAKPSIPSSIPVPSGPGRRLAREARARSARRRAKTAELDEPPPSQSRRARRGRTTPRAWSSARGEVRRARRGAAGAATTGPRLPEEPRGDRPDRGEHDERRAAARPAVTPRFSGCRASVGLAARPRPRAGSRAGTRR